RQIVSSRQSVGLEPDHPATAAEGSGSHDPTRCLRCEPNRSLTNVMRRTNWKAHAGQRLWIAGNYLLAVLLALMRLPFLARALGPNRLDDSWSVDNYLAVLNHATFGTSYIWTFGPLGFVNSPKLVSRHLLAVSVVLQVTLAVLLAVLLVHVLTFRVRLRP